MTYTLHHGDCLDILPTLEAQSVDAIIADPPYGTTACKWDSVIPFAPMWAQLKRIIKPRGAIVLFGSQPFTSALVMSNVGWFRDLLIWDKNTSTGHLDANRRPLKRHEDVVIFAQGNTTYNPQKHYGPPNHHKGRLKQNYKDNVYHGRYNFVESDRSGMKYPTTIIQFDRIAPAARAHSTQKPLALLEYLVKTYTHAGDTVLDFTMGSGTTGEACINTGRNFIGIEKEQTYYDITAKRLDAAAARMVQMELAV